MYVAIGFRQHLFEELRDEDAVLDRRVELQAKVRRELEVLEPAAELVPDEAFGRDQAGERLLLLLRISEHADAHARRPEVRRHANRRDAHESDPRIFELAPNDGHDLLAYLLSDLIRAVAGHNDIRCQHGLWAALTKFLPFC